MKKLVLPLVCLLTGLIVSCNDSTQQEAIDKAEKEVFALHDEVMPKIDDIMKLRKQISQRITALDSAVTSTDQTNKEKEQAIRLNRQLSEADSLMMTWMSGYNGDTLKQLEPADAIRYLEQEKQKITDVKQKINGSIEQATKYLGKQ